MITKFILTIVSSIASKDLRYSRPRTELKDLTINNCRLYQVNTLYNRLRIQEQESKMSKEKNQVGTYLRWCRDGNDCIYNDCGFHHQVCEHFLRGKCNIPNPMLKPPPPKVKVDWSNFEEASKYGCKHDHRDPASLHTRVEKVPMEQTSDIIKLFGDKGIVKIYESKEVYEIAHMPRVDKKLLKRSLYKAGFTYETMLYQEGTEYEEEFLCILSEPKQPELEPIPMKDWIDIARFEYMDDVCNGDAFDTSELSDLRYRILFLSLVKGGFKFHPTHTGYHECIMITHIPGKDDFGKSSSDEEVIHEHVSEPIDLNFTAKSYFIDHDLKYKEENGKLTMINFTRDDMFAFVEYMERFVGIPEARIDVIAEVSPDGQIINATKFIIKL